MSELRKMTRINKAETTLECIIASYLDPESYKLTEKQEEIRQRYRFVNQLLLNADPVKAIINKCMETFGISEQQAFVDLRNTRKLYGNIAEADFKGARYLHYQYAMANYKKACKQRDLNAQRQAIQLMHELSGGNDDQSTFNPEKLEAFDYVIQLPKHLEELYEKELKKGTMDFNKISAEDAEYLELE